MLAKYKTSRFSVLDISFQNFAEYCNVIHEKMSGFVEKSRHSPTLSDVVVQDKRTKFWASVEMDDFKYVVTLANGKVVTKRRPHNRPPFTPIRSWSWRELTGERYGLHF